MPNRMLPLLAAGLLVFAAPVRLPATTVVPPSFAELVNGSDYIVHAVVRDVRAEKRDRNGAPRIVTLVELEVREVVAGEPPATVVLELLGGSVGRETMTVTGQPQFAVGDEDILFVKGNGRSLSPLYAMMFGRYPVRTDAVTGRRWVARENGSPLAAITAVATAMDSVPSGPAPAPGMAPADFIRAIRATYDRPVPNPQ